MFVRIFLLFMLSVAISGRYFLFAGINNVNVCKSIFQIIIIVFDMPDFFFWGGGVRTAFSSGSIIYVLNVHNWPIYFFLYELIKLQISLINKKKFRNLDYFIYLKKYHSRTIFQIIYFELWKRYKILSTVYLEDYFSTSELLSTDLLLKKNILLVK